MKAFACQGGQLLADQPYFDTQCYSGSAVQATAAFGFIFFFTYSIGFPIACVYLVHRVVYKKRRASAAAIASEQLGAIELKDLSVTNESQPAQGKQDGEAAKEPHEQPDQQLDTSSDTERKNSDPETTDHDAHDLQRQSTDRVVHKRMHDPKRISRYGFLFRDLKVNRLHSQLGVDVTTFWFRTNGGGSSAPGCSAA